jgi:NAD(P)-dependent dehydrogenase (short-subunit alcohol dehydrogenase family)
MTNLAGKTALVTGASRGMGRASALALAQEGAQVLVHYGRSKAEAEVVAEIRSAGRRAGCSNREQACRSRRPSRTPRLKISTVFSSLAARAVVCTPGGLHLDEGSYRCSIVIEHAGHATSGATPVYWPSGCFSCIRRCPLDYRRHPSSRWRVETLTWDGDRE